MKEENDNPKRPNANYKLSKPDTKNVKEEELVFYYNREQRLSKAPLAVQKLYTEHTKKRGVNIFRPLIADKPRAMLFFTIVALCAILLMLSILGFIDKAYTLDGNKLELSGIGFENTAIILIKKTAGKDFPYTGAVDIAVSPVVEDGADYTVFYHRVFFTLEKNEDYRFVVPFDQSSLAMVLHTEKSTLKIILNID
jgi:hypothetical protein